jgi:hypothetical protein
MSNDSNPRQPQPEPPAKTEERAQNLGCGIGLLVAGGLVIANQLGWIKGVDWVFPAVLIGLAANYLYKAFSRR